MKGQEINALFFEIHRDNPREGPGSFESTRKAFRMLSELPPRPRILDIGCGPGRQTLDLSRLTSGTITAVDNHQPYVDRLANLIEEKGLSDRVTTVYGDMKALDFKEESFDVIWAEGSIYIIGFENGLRSLKPFLKHGGYLATSELTWLDPNAPEKLRLYWEENYPQMKNTAENVDIIRQSGYFLAGFFVLPQADWWDNYYSPVEKKLIRLRRKYADDGEALAFLEEEQREIDLFRNYSDYYGYVFYVARRD
jgi:SAM-dependent methyltransferase